MTADRIRLLMASVENYQRFHPREDTYEIEHAELLELCRLALKVLEAPTFQLERPLPHHGNPAPWIHAELPRRYQNKRVAVVLVDEA